MIKNVSAAVTLLVRAEASEHFMHADVDAFGAPSECHDLVERGLVRQRRLDRRRLHGLTGLSIRAFHYKLKKEYGLAMGSPKWQTIVGRVYQRTYPF